MATLEPYLPVLDAAGDFGVGTVLRQTCEELAEVATVLDRFRLSGTAHYDRPFSFDSARLCVATYVAALGQVNNRFWATTFLSSGFWTTDDAEILGANLRMLEDLKRHGVTSRRLFLLHVPLEAEVQRWEDERILLQKHEDWEGLRRFDARFANLRRNIANLLAHGCDVRVLHDAEGQYKGLPEELAFESDDSELAVYDDWRLDVFRGGRSGALGKVHCFTPVMTRFSQIRDQTLEYFERLWSEAQPIQPLLARIQKGIEDSSARIDYPTIWLARYDYGLPEEDKVLKTAELCSVKMELQRLRRWGENRRYLDVGTCTGRYPLALRDAVHPSGEILGIDVDLDCVRFARWNLRQQCPDDRRLRIERQDFCAGEFAPGAPFDLITCMLGTLLHLGRNPDESFPYHDGLQHALEKAARLLTDTGLFFFSIWSEEACADLRLLSIYTQEDMRRLAAWAPTRGEIGQRLRAAGLDFEPPLPLEGRMYLYRCRRSPSAAL